MVDLGPTSASRIDHVIASSAMGNSTVHLTTTCTFDNHLHSDHVPLQVYFNINVDHFDITERQHVSRTAWSKGLMSK